MILGALTAQTSIKAKRGCGNGETSQGDPLDTTDAGTNEYMSTYSPVATPASTT